MLRSAKPELYGNLTQPGVNAEGKTVKSPVDAISFVAGADPRHMVTAQHTIGLQDDLGKKWLHDPSTVTSRKGTKPVAPAGDVVKTAVIANDERSKRDLRGLYRSRWQVELDLRSIKTVMQMEPLRCMSPQVVEKEIAAHLLAYNLVRAVMATAAYPGAVPPRQLSFKAALQLLRAFEQNLRHCPQGRLAIRHAHLLGAIAQMKLPHRPGRVEPRAIKRRPKPHKLLTEPRNIVRERLLIQQQRHVAAFLR